MPHSAAAGSHFRKRRAIVFSTRRFLAALSFWLLLFFLLAGCGHTRHTFDPRLRKIDQLLSAQLPAGTPRGRVQYFLKSRGYQLEEGDDKTSLRALVRHVDPDTLQPSAARATFHFDGNEKLTTYELEPAPF